MGILSRAGDLVYTFRFLRLLTTAWEDTTAFKRGIIDSSGARIKTYKLESAEDFSAYNAFHKLVFNIKRLLAKAPGGGSKFATYAAALFLLKEKYGIHDFNKIIKESNVDPLDFLSEGTSWFVLENDQLAPGVYKLRGPKMVNETCDELGQKDDKIRINTDCFPVGNVMGLDVYEAVHMKTGQTVYVTVGELLR